LQVDNPARALWNIIARRAPIEAQLIVTRRCNLSCGYCTEFDNHSNELPLESLKSSIDALHRLNVVYISLLGGEPLTHPRIDEIVAYAGTRSAVSITTNGFLISDDIIDRLNGSGLGNMQVSVDTLSTDPTRYIQKTMKTLLPKLRRVMARADFDVHVNVVLCDASRSEFKTFVAALTDLGLRVTVNLLHDSRGAVQIGGPEYAALWDHHYDSGNPLSHAERAYGRSLLSGERPKWQCRAGSRYLYVDEYGNAQFCSAQRGRLEKPISDYTIADLRAHARTHKGCESGCAVFCVYRASQIDNDPLTALVSLARSVRSGAVKRRAPRSPVAAPHAAREAIAPR
jgi:molybdenum cofactor biosynthesis enzyme MoaA